MSSRMEHKLLRVGIDEDGDDCEIEIPVEVEFIYFAGFRGYRDSLGVPEEPDENESAEVISVKDLSGNEIRLSDKETLQVEEACVEHVNNR